jgi:hypothetical protein
MNIRPKHSNISKRVGEGVFTICVVLDQSTVIFQKGEGYYNLCGIEIKIVAILCFIRLSLTPLFLSSMTTLRDLARILRPLVTFAEAEQIFFLNYE